MGTKCNNVGQWDNQSLDSQLIQKVSSTIKPNTMKNH